MWIITEDGCIDVDGTVMSVRDIIIELKEKRIAVKQLKKILENLNIDLGVRLKRLAVRECSCVDQDSFCIVCQAEEMLDTLNTAVQMCEEKK